MPFLGKGASIMLSTLVSLSNLAMKPLRFQIFSDCHPANVTHLALKPWPLGDPLDHGPMPFDTGTIRNPLAPTMGISRERRRNLGQPCTQCEKIAGVISSPVSFGACHVLGEL